MIIVKPYDFAALYRTCVLNDWSGRYKPTRQKNFNVAQFFAHYEFVVDDLFVQISQKIK